MIPLILGAVALGTAAVGAMKGSEGVGNMNEANEIGKRAQEKHERAVRQLKADWEATNKLAEEYGQLQLNVKKCTIGRFVTLIERIGQRASQSELLFLEGLDISTQQIKEYKTTAMEAEDWFKGSVSATVAGAAAGSSAVTLASSVGTVTVTRFFGLWATEVGISQLGGAAARSATLAWLGGSSMAVGGLVLGGITLGPALMVGGFQIAGKGEEALTKVREYEAKVNAEIAKVEAAKDFLRQVKRRIVELSDLVHDLNIRTELGLDELETKAFERSRDAGKFQQVLLLVTALGEIIKTSVLDSEGQLNPGAATIQAKYRILGGN
jgi:hypothetical protein